MLILQREVAKHKSHETADPFATNNITHSFLGYIRYYESVRHKQAHRYFSLSLRALGFFT